MLGATTYFMLRKILGLDSESSGRSSREYMYLDQLLTAKHIQAMSSFLESNHDFMLVVCDDVTVGSGQRLKVTDLIQILSDNPEAHGIFVELAPFYEQAQLSRDFNYQVKNRFGEHWYQTDFFANTAACYLINRNAANVILKAVFENPFYRNISIDWLLTYIGIRKTSGIKLNYWTNFPPSYLNSSLYTGIGGLVGDGNAIVPKSKLN
jgi:hypothetical protein